ncbi:MAG TPA: hypothetical protein VJ997_02980, partial [Longimicrobiales bacterium]|nr:hypothetical protein [Longimicrobiales bacterium]
MDTRLFAPAEPHSTPMLTLLQRAGVVCLVAGTFFSTFRDLRMGQVNFLLSDLFFVLAGPALLLTFRTERILPFASPRVRLAWFTGTLMLTFGLTVSTLVNGDSLRGIIVVGQYLFALLVLPGLLAIAPPWSRRLLGRSYLLGIGVVSAIGVVLYFLFPLQARVYSFGGRMASLLGDPNAFSKVIGISVPLLLAMIVREEIPRIMAGVVGVFCLGGVLVAASFSGLAANLVAFVIFFALLGRMKEILRLSLVLLVLGSAYFYTFGMPDIVERRIVPVLMARDLSAAPNFDSRLSGVTEALRMVRSPLIGVGADDFR